MARFEIETILTARNTAGDAFLELIGQIEIASQKLDEFGAKSPTATLDVDDTRVDSVVDRASRKADEFGAKRVTAELDADAAKADTAIDRATRKADEFGAKRETAQLDADAQRADAAIDQATRKVDEFGNKRETAQLDADNTPVTQATNAAIAKVDEFGNKNVKAELDADNLPAIRATDTAITKVDQFGAKRVSAELNADNTPAIRATDTAITRVDQFGAKRVSAKLDADNSAAIRSLTEANRQLDGFGRRRAVAQADVDITPKHRAMDEANKQLDAFGRRRSSATADVNIDPKHRAMDNANRQMDAWGRRRDTATANVDVDRGMANLRAIGGEADRTRERFHTLGITTQTLTGIFRLIVGAVEGATFGMADMGGIARTAGTSLTGLIVVVGAMSTVLGLAAAAVGPLTAGLVVLAATVTPLIVGVGLLALAFAPLIQAIQKGKGANEEYTKAQKALDTATSDLETKQQAQALAQEKVSRLTQEGGQTATQAQADQNKLATAHDAVEKAQLAQSQSQEKVNQLYASGKQGTDEYAKATNDLETKNQGLQQAIEKYTGVQDLVNTKVGEGTTESGKLATAQADLEKKNLAVEQATGKVNTAQETLNNTTNTQQGYVKDLLAKWQELKDSYVDNFEKNEKLGESMGRLSEKVLSLAQKAMPELATASQKTVDEVSGAFDRLGEKVDTSTFKTFLDNVPSMMGKATEAVGTFGTGFLNIMNQANPLAQQFLDWVNRTADNFLRWTESEEGRAKIQEFLDSVVPLAKSFWEQLEKVVPPLIEIGVKHGPVVAEALRKIGDFLTILIDGLNIFLGIVDKVTGALGAIADALNTVSGAFDTAGIAAHDFIVEHFGGILTWLQETFLPDLVSVVQPIYDELIKPFVDAYNEIFGESIIPDLASGVTKTLSDLATSGIPGALGSLVTNLTKPFTQGSQEVGSTVSQMSTETLSNFTTLVTDSNQKLQEMVEIMQGPFVEGAKLAGAALDEFNTHVIHTFDEIVNWAQKKLDEFGNAVSDGMAEMTKASQSSLEDMNRAFMDGFNNMDKTTNDRMSNIRDDYQSYLNDMVTATNDAVTQINKAMSQMQKAPTQTATNPQTGETHTVRPRAYGGVDGTPGTPFLRAAYGAHFVEDSTMMQWGGESILYGEALSPGNREYAFQDGGSMTFITEQPGFDDNSFALWSELGQRKGFLSGSSQGSSGGNGWRDLGKELVAGLIEGMQSKEKDLERTTKSIAQGTIDTAADEFETHSRSEVTYQMGLDLGQGLIDGMMAMIEKIKAAALAMAQAATQTLGQTISQGASNAASSTGLYPIGYGGQLLTLSDESYAADPNRLQVLAAQARERGDLVMASRYERAWRDAVAYQAHQRDLAARRARGMAWGGHYVEGPTMMQRGTSSIFYGEALSGGNREYAFEDGGSMTFITEEPGYDANSYGLWSELGERKGYSSGDPRLRREVVALRRDVLEVVDAIRELESTNIKGTETLTDVFARLSPKMRKDLIDMAKNDPEFRRQAMKGQSSELERKIFGGP